MRASPPTSLRCASPVALSLRSSPRVSHLLTTHFMFLLSRPHSYPKLKHKLRVLTSNCYVVSFFMSLLLLGNFGYSVYVLRVKLQAPLE